MLDLVKIKIMKKILSILIVSVLFIGCGESGPKNTELKEIFTKRVLLDELINKGSEESELMYYESGLFNGIGYDVFSDGQLKIELKYTDGKYGLYKEWSENGQLHIESKYKDGKKDGIFKRWYDNG